jgi:hypothetical protein
VVLQRDMENQTWTAPNRVIKASDSVDRQGKAAIGEITVESLVAFA